MSADLPQAVAERSVGDEEPGRVVAERVKARSERLPLGAGNLLDRCVGHQVADELLVTEIDLTDETLLQTCPDAGGDEFDVMTLRGGAVCAEPAEDPVDREEGGRGTSPAVAP